MDRSFWFTEPNKKKKTIWFVVSFVGSPLLISIRAPFLFYFEKDLITILMLMFMVFIYLYIVLKYKLLNIFYIISIIYMKNYKILILFK
jgi:hypothetical protein